MDSQDQKIIGNMLSDEKIYGFIVHNLKQTLPSIGFSVGLTEELTENLRNLNIQKFFDKYSQELDEVFTVGFFKKIVPAYFEKYVIPEIPNSDNFLDVGCGTGILINRLAKTNSFNKLIGIDVLRYPEWESYSGKNNSFQIVNDNQFPAFLKAYKPDSIALTWTLHHMRTEEQSEYLELIFSNIKEGSKLVILEDSYSETLQPENGQKKYKEFMSWNEESRKKIMSVYDWIANRILAQRIKVSIP